MLEVEEVEEEVERGAMRRDEVAAGVRACVVR